MFEVGDVGQERASGRLRLVPEGGILPDRELIHQRGPLGSGPASGTAGDPLRERVGRVDAVQGQPGLQVADGAELLGPDPLIAGDDLVGQDPSRGPTPTGSGTTRLTTIEHEADSRSRV